MKSELLLVLLWLGPFVLVVSGAKNLLQFGNMIKAVTGRSSLDYNGYGCWCGLGGSGPTVDGTDHCCKVHDKCYDEVEAFDCSPKIFNMYNYEASSGSATCLDKPDSCDYQICQCDRAAAECFFKNLATYNSSNKDDLHATAKCQTGYDPLSCWLPKSSGQLRRNLQPSKPDKRASCPLGSSLSYDKTRCIPCAPGYFASSTTFYCTSSDNSMSSCCSRCTTGSVCPGFGTSSPIQCKPGTSANFERTECLKAPPGYYAAKAGYYCDKEDNGPLSCFYKCPSGRVCPCEATVDPIPCQPGTSANYERTECLPAPPGYYARSAETYCTQPDNSPSSCFYRCQNGYICPGIGTFNPVKCPAGFSTNFAKIKCLIAPPGYYAANPGYYCDNAYETPLSCFNRCPNGRICPSAGTVSPIPCQPGTSANYERTECLKASPGYYVGSAETYCTQPDNSPSSCFYKCQNGYICPNYGTSQPEFCPAGYSTNYAKTKCLIAPPGYYAANPGYYCDKPDEAPLSCFYKCPSGYICPGSGTSTPIPCPTGTTSNAQATSCVSCSSGTC